MSSSVAPMTYRHCVWLDCDEVPTVCAKHHAAAVRERHNWEQAQAKAYRDWVAASERAAIAEAKLADLRDAVWAESRDCGCSARIIGRADGSEA